MQMKALPQRFWPKVDRGTPDECWEWQAAVKSNGYGQIQVDGKPEYAHRVAVKLDDRDLPDDMQVNHHCDNRSCVNPKHLYIGTQQENRQDAVDRERTATGEDNGSSKLDWQDVGAIRRDYALTSKTQYDLADKYGTTHGHISKIVRGLTWNKS